MGRAQDQPAPPDGGGAGQPGSADDVAAEGGHDGGRDRNQRSGFWTGPKNFLSEIPDAIRWVAALIAAITALVGAVAALENVVDGTCLLAPLCRAASPTPSAASRQPTYALDVHKGNVTVLGPTSGLKAAQVTPIGDHLEFAFSGPGQGNTLVYATAPVVAYTEQLQLRITSRSVTFYITLNQRPPNLPGYSLQLNAANGMATFLRREANGGEVPMGQSQPLPGLSAGQLLILTIAVNPPNYSLSADGRVVMQATDGRPNSTPGQPGLAGTGSDGSVQIYKAEIVGVGG